MGIKNMLKFLNTNYPNVIRKIDTVNFEGKLIAIDISILLYQVIIAIRNSGADLMNNQGEITSHILGLFNKTINLLKMNIIPVYIFDGKPPEFKNKILSERREIKQKAYNKMQTPLSEEDKIKYFKRTVSISKAQINECIELLETMGIPYIVAEEEADSLCAELVKKGLVDGVLTEDMDIMTFGATKIYRNLTSYKKDNIMILMEDILQALNITYEQFVELCILFGCDYCEGVKDISPENIYKYYIKNKNIKDTHTLMKTDGYILPDIDNIYKCKEYFINSQNSIINKINIKKCDVSKLEKLLVSKYGLVKMKIQDKLIYITQNFNSKVL